VGLVVGNVLDGFGEVFLRAFYVLPDDLRISRLFSLAHLILLDSLVG
jgi:hypothetical protein